MNYPEENPTTTPFEPDATKTFDPVFERKHGPGSAETPSQQNKNRFSLVDISKKKKSESYTITSETTPLCNHDLGRNSSINNNPQSALQNTEKNGSRVQVRNKAGALWMMLSEHVQAGSPLLRSFSDEEMDEKAQAVIRQDIEISLVHCIIAFAIYICIAVVAFSFVFSNFTIIDSIYFSVSVLSTVGYGDHDLLPRTHAARIFTSIFALSSVACLGVAIGIVGSKIIEAEQAALERASALSEQRVLSLFSATHLYSSASLPLGNKDGGPSTITTATGPYEEGRRSFQFCRRIILEFCFVTVVLVIFGVAVAQDPALSGSDVGYFLIITSTSVGLGDIAPTSQLGRLATAIFIPLSVGVMGRWLAMVATWIIENRQASFVHDLESYELTYEDLDAMDENGDGKVTRAEFLEFILVAMGKIDREWVEQLRVNFLRLDINGTGVLSKGDLIAIARRKLKDPRRKLELARYKLQLLEQAKRRRLEGARRRSSIWRGGLSTFSPNS